MKKESVSDIVVKALKELHEKPKIKQLVSEYQAIEMLIHRKNKHKWELENEH